MWAMCETKIVDPVMEVVPHFRGQFREIVSRNFWR
jgi:hypothetical protein